MTMASCKSTMSHEIMPLILAPTLLGAMLSTQFTDEETGIRWLNNLPNTSCLGNDRAENPTLVFMVPKFLLLSRPPWAWFWCLWDFLVSLPNTPYPATKLSRFPLVLPPSRRACLFTLQLLPPYSSLTWEDWTHKLGPEHSQLQWARLGRNFRRSRIIFLSANPYQLFCSWALKTPVTSTSHSSCMTLGAMTRPSCSSPWLPEPRRSKIQDMDVTNW